jgi:DNA mismatch endonuclease (patch repair protein)
MAESWATSKATRKSMQSNRGRDTAPELAVRRLLHAQGFRYRVNYRPEPGLRRTADIVFTKQKIAVFIDGCFWHGCPEHYQRPASNQEYWDAKVTANRMRDFATTNQLRSQGWTVLRYWEHCDALVVAMEIGSELGRCRAVAASGAH